MSKGQRGNPTPAVTQISAALTIWQWILEHGREPYAHECRNANGLYGYDLYYRVFGTNNFSAGVIPAVSALCSSGVKMRQCLGYTRTGDDCHNRFPNVGDHVRLCETCRRQGEEIQQHSLPRRVGKLTPRELGAGPGGWGYSEPWTEDINWGGASDRS